VPDGIVPGCQPLWSTPARCETARADRRCSFTRPSLAAAAEHPDWLPAHTTAELRQVIEDHHGQVHGTGLDTTPGADPHMLAIARRGIGALTLALNALLPEVAGQASHPADQLAAQAGAMLAAEFFDCYAGRLRTYLNPCGRRPGQTSSIVIGGRQAGGRAMGPDRHQPPAKQMIRARTPARAGRG
jgi:hypothetical protein